METGFALCDITPENGIYLTGYGRPERLATDVHSKLYASVMVMEDDNTLAAVIALDWCFVDWRLTVAIRNGISEASGIPAENILMCCSHTHSAPHTTYDRTLGRVAVDPENKGVEYALNCTPVLAQAVCTAKAALRPTEAAFASGKTMTGVSRRGMNEDGVVAGFLADPDAVYDDNMTVVRFRDSSTGEDQGIIVHCSAHNTAMGVNTSISSDWCGVMKKRINCQYKVPVLFINGACGDVGPRTSFAISGPGFSGYAAGVGDGINSVNEVGYRAAADALTLLSNMRDFTADLPIKLHVSTINLPQEIPISKEEAEAAIAKYEAEDINKAEPPLAYQLSKIALQTWSQPIQQEYSFERTILAFGPMALVPFPYEMFSIFSLRLRKYGPFEYTLMCSNTNGRNAYMPDRGAIAAGGYEVTCRKTIRPYVLKAEAGDLAVKMSLEQLRSMK